MTELPNLTDAVQLPSLAGLTGPASSHPPRILLLYGSLSPAYSPKSDRSGCVRLKAL